MASPSQPTHEAPVERAAAGMTAARIVPITV